MTGIAQSRQVQLSKVAVELPNAGKEESKIMQFRRWLSNERIAAEVYFLPFIELVLSSIAGHSLVLAIDGSVTGRGCISLMVSVLYKGRMLPVVWVTRQGKKGHFPEARPSELRRKVPAILPPHADVICVGDGEFDGVDWLNILERFGWHYVCRTAQGSVFYEEGERFAIQDICPSQGGCTGISGLRFTDKKHGPVMAVAWWGKEYDAPVYLVTNFETAGEACNWYKKRFRIETLFSDCKSRGFQLHKSRLSDPNRVSRLLIAVALAYIWIVYLGEYAKQNGWSEILHRKDRCDLSLFQLGGLFLKRWLKQLLPLPPFRFAMPGNLLD